MFFLKSLKKTTDNFNTFNLDQSFHTNLLWQSTNLFGKQLQSVLLASVPLQCIQNNYKIDYNAHIIIIIINVRTHNVPIWAYTLAIGACILY